MKRGFALPIVLITSTVMLIVVMASLVAVASTRVALDNQYYDQLAREAAEAGLIRANECYLTAQEGEDTSKWPYSGELRPDTNCLGEAQSSQPSTVIPVTGGRYVTSFRVRPPDVNPTNGDYTLSATGIVRLVRASSATQTSKVYDIELKQAATPEQLGIQSGKGTVCSIVKKRLFCWGQNEAGQIGDGTKTNRNVPVPVPIVDSTGKTLNIYSVASGWSHTCAIAGPALQSTVNNASVWCWGDNSKGQLAVNPTTLSESLTPRQIPNTTFPNSLQFDDISARDHTCLLVTIVSATSANNGQQRVYCWGLNNQGQSGYGVGSSTPDPKFDAADIRIPLSQSTGGYFSRVQKITSVSPGNTCMIALSSGTSGFWTGFCLGANDYNGRFGVLGSGSATSPTASPTGYRVNPALGFSDIVSNNTRTCALRNGQLWCWGSNMSLGSLATTGRIDPAEADNIFPSPRLLPQSQSTDAYRYRFTKVAVSANSTCAITAATVTAGPQSGDSYDRGTIQKRAGEVWCFGVNDQGQLGNGTFSPSSNLSDRIPSHNMTQVRGPLQGKRAVNITAGNNHFCVTTDTNEAYCWGSNTNGELGNGRPDAASATPAKVKRLSPTLF